MLQINRRTVNGITILDLSGRLTIGGGDKALQEATSKEVAEGSKKVVFNLKGLTTMDSSGMGQLVTSHSSLSNKAARLVLTNMPPKLKDLLMITGVDAVFTIYADEDEAIKNLA